VSIDEFVHAVAWCKEPAVREAVRGIFQRTTDWSVFARAVEAIGDDEAGLIVKKADAVLNDLTAEERKYGICSMTFSMFWARVRVQSLFQHFAGFAKKTHLMNSES